jgi:hypothetical protein
MEFGLNEEQRTLVDAVDALLAGSSGPTRAIELGSAGFDAALNTALGDTGFDRVALDLGPLDAVLVIERVAHAGGAISTGASLLVGPMLCGEILPGPVALVEPGRSTLARFAPGAKTVIGLCDDEARLFHPTEPLPPVEANFGFPLGRVPEGAILAGRSLGARSAAGLLRWWRLALAAEVLGAATAALDCTVAYLSQRRQFGQPIGAFQAVQHRLADAAVRLEGLRWLTYETAYRGADAEAAATTAGLAAELAGQIHRETHQLTGAIGFTHEHDLHVYTMRLKALELELGGASAHYRDVARLRWNADA